MDLIQLDYFVTACEKGSLSRVAACRYTSQPNVSKKIRELEKELGHSLLQRSGKGVVPTPFGQSILEYAQTMLRTAGSITALAAPGERRKLRVSSYPSNMISRLLTDCYLAFDGKIGIDYQVGSPEQTAENVGLGRSEIGIVYLAQSQLGSYRRMLAQEGMELEPVSTRGICLYVGPNHPLYEEKQVNFSQLKELKYLRGVRDHYALANCLACLSAGQVSSRDLHCLVSTGSEHLVISSLLRTDLCCLGLDFVYSSYKTEGISAVSIAGCEKALTLGVISRRGGTLSPEAQWLMEGLKRIL